MQFTLTDDAPVSLEMYFLWAVLFLAVPVSIAMLLWLRRRVRADGDALRSSPRPERD